MNPEDRLFTSAEGLRALRKLHPVAGEKTSGHQVFKIQVDSNGEPWLSVKDTRGEILSDSSESRVLTEIRRISGGGFDIEWGGNEDKELRVSLWKCPYLMLMLRDCHKITDESGAQISFSEDLVSLILKLNKDENDNQIIPQIVVRNAEDDVAIKAFLSANYVLAGRIIYNIAPVGDNYSHIGSMLATVPGDLLETYLSLFVSYFDNITPELDGLAARYYTTPEHAFPTLVLQKVAPDKALYLSVTVTTDSQSISPDMAMEITRSVAVTESGQIIIRPITNVDLRDKVEQLETMLYTSAPSRQARKDIYRDGNFFIVPAETAGLFLLKHLVEILSEFKLLGSEKLNEYQVTAATPKLNVRLSSGIDFLEGDANVTIGDDVFTIGDFLARCARNRYVTLSDGKKAIVDEKYINRLKRLFSRADNKGHIRVTLFDLPEVEDLIKSKITGDFATHAREVFQGFNNIKRESLKSVNVKAVLRPYQQEGIKWIKYLYDNNLGGCLADDMGLGKTLQTIAVLSVTTQQAKGPALVIMPRSLLFNWEKELSRFAPQLSVATYYGPGRQLKDVMKSDVILTTYATVRNDIEELKEESFDYVILDESQNIKNVSSQTSNAVMLLNASHRLALSGTPMENNLTEIYSLFRFLNPTMFGDIETFNTSYTMPIQRDGDKDAINSLRRRIFPFILRRLKRDVLKDLPDRIDQTIYVEMSDRQKALYNERRVFYKQQIKDTILREGVAKSQFVMFQALSELRRIASVPESVSDGHISSPKISELVDSLQSSIENGHKAVVFFNFLAGIELVGERLEKLGIDFDTMTGSSAATQRRRTVDRFQTDPKCKVLLMTLKVGGVGLNLTAADTVYIMEPWWNKAVEEQAVNRLHRIGQKATVNTFTAITVDSIEEKILQLQEQKSELFDRLIGADGASSKHLSEEDIDFILS